MLHWCTLPIDQNRLCTMLQWKCTHHSRSYSWCLPQGPQKQNACERKRQDLIPFTAPDLCARHYNRSAKLALGQLLYAVHTHRAVCRRTSASQRRGAESRSAGQSGHHRQNGSGCPHCRTQPAHYMIHERLPEIVLLSLASLATRVVAGCCRNLCCNDSPCASHT